LDQIAKHLPRKHKALILNLTNAKKKKKNQKLKKQKKETCALSSSLFF
jgi:hypothetical protein